MREAVRSSSNAATFPLEDVAGDLLGDPRLLRCGFCYDPAREAAFHTGRSVLWERARTSPGMFCSNDWVASSDGGERQSLFNAYSEACARFPWNDGASSFSPVLPMFGLAPAYHPISDSIESGYVVPDEMRTYGVGYYFAGDWRRALEWAHPTEGQGTRVCLSLSPLPLSPTLSRFPPSLPSLSPLRLGP
jgi:hypothetical protein